MAKNNPPCHLHIVLARIAPVGVILRRGPSKWVRLIKWNIIDDTFELGHWLHGTIYEYGCDLSPDGTKFIYGARQHKRPGPDVWTAISKPPWLTAIVFWPATTSRDIGGHFIDDNTVQLNDFDNKLTPRDPLPPELKVLKWCQTQSNQDITEDSSPIRLIRDDEVWPHRVDTCKLHPKGHLKLIETTLRYANGSSRMLYSIQSRNAAQSEPLKGVSWASWDHRERLIYPKNGRLFASEVSDNNELLPAKELADFNDQKPEPIEPPDWARHW